MTANRQEKYGHTLDCQDDKKMSRQSKKFIFLGVTNRQGNMATAKKTCHKKVQKSQNPMGNKVLNSPPQPSHSNFLTTTTQDNLCLNS